MPHVILHVVLNAHVFAAGHAIQQSSYNLHTTFLAKEIVVTFIDLNISDTKPLSGDADLST